MITWLDLTGRRNGAWWKKAIEQSRFHSMKFPLRRFVWKCSGTLTRCSGISAPGRQRIGSSKQRGSIRSNDWKKSCWKYGASAIGPGSSRGRSQCVLAGSHRRSRRREKADFPKNRPPRHLGGYNFIGRLELLV